MNLHTIQEADIQGKVVIIRSDMNVPMENGKIQSNQRIIASLPTIRYVLEKGGKAIIVSHLGRPVEGEYTREYSLSPVAKSLSEYLDCEVPLYNIEQGGDIPSESCVLCENIRFLQGEVENSTELSQKLALLGDIFIMDAFGTAHRAHASTVGITQFLPSYAGFLLQEEIGALEKAIHSMSKPSVAIVGGSKVSSKLDILENLAKKVDTLIVGGGIANTFLLALGHSIGKSLCEKDFVEKAREIMKSTHVLLPRDVAVVKEIHPNSAVLYKSIDSLEEKDIIVDIGMITSDVYAQCIEEAKSILWNGPVGIFENPTMSFGTEAICRAIADSSAYSVAGGGDTISAIELFGIADSISYISTGGGAFLEYIEGKELPAIVALQKK